MSKIIGLVLLVIGAVLIYYGIQAGDSLASNVKEVVDGTPTDETMKYYIGGAISAAIGVGLILYGKKGG